MTESHQYGTVFSRGKKSPARVRVVTPDSHQGLRHELNGARLEVIDGHKRPGFLGEPVRPNTNFHPRIFGKPNEKYHPRLDVEPKKGIIEHLKRRRWDM